MRLRIVKIKGRQIETSGCVLLINWPEEGSYGYVSSVMALPGQTQLDAKVYGEIQDQAGDDEAVVCFIEGDELVICGENSLALS